MLRTHWLTLPTNLQRITWLSLGMLLFALTIALTKRLAETLHPLELSLFRCVVAMLVLTQVFMHVKGRGVPQDYSNPHYLVVHEWSRRQVLKPLAKLPFLQSCVAPSAKNQTARWQFLISTVFGRAL